ADYFVFLEVRRRAAEQPLKLRLRPPDLDVQPLDLSLERAQTRRGLPRPAPARPCGDATIEPGNHYGPHSADARARAWKRVAAAGVARKQSHPRHQPRVAARSAALGRLRG